MSNTKRSMPTSHRGARTGTAPKKKPTPKATRPTIPAKKLEEWLDVHAIRTEDVPQSFSLVLPDPEGDEFEVDTLEPRAFLKKEDAILYANTMATGTIRWRILHVVGHQVVLGEGES